MFINVIDRAFIHVPLPGGISVKEPTYFKWVRDQRSFKGISIYTDDMISKLALNHFGGNNKIAMIWEPRCISPNTYSRILEIENEFDEIWTYDEILLNRNEKYKHIIPFSAWVSKETFLQKSYNKSIPISMIFSNKKISKNHRFRHEVYNNIDHNVVTFFGSGM